ncbi:hypothetical protein C8J56DRAFT_926843 [Mycena floridula]|nr:hypothetical protein C8J56DRAFT_926843 [Mycena floridula]
MPLFKSRPESDTEEIQQNNSTPARKGSIFTRNRSASPPHSESSPTSRRGFFNQRNSSDDDSIGRQSTTNGSIRSNGGMTGFFGGVGRRGNDVHSDPSIVAARQKLSVAEEAEKEADRALIQARAMVKEARDHVKGLEREAKEDVVRAQAKQAEAKIMGKTARTGLGRHGP